MPLNIDTSYYSTGTATVAADGTTVTGQSTAWLQAVRAGDLFGTHVGDPVRIASVDSNTQLTLAYPWKGPAQTESAYEIQFTPYDTGYQAAVRQLLTMLASGNVEALAELTGEYNALPIFLGPGAMGLISKEELVNGVHFDVQVDDLAGRAAYDDRLEGYTVLVADVGDGRSAIYMKNSAATGDWSDPAYITGPVGPLPDVTVGATNTLEPGSSATVTGTPTAGGIELEFGIPEGRGAKYTGEYDPGTTYELDDAVLYNGSTWIALQETTGNAPPVLPTTSNTYWSLLARQGTDGAGTGDVVGPNGATNDHVALFDGTTGKLLKDGFSVSSFMRTVLDDADAATARGTLELGTAATQNSSAFATAAQGVKADNAQPALGYTPANKAGDTFTGPVAVRAGTSWVQWEMQSYGWSSGYRGWAQYLDSSGDLSFYSYNFNTGAYIGRPLMITQSGNVYVSGTLAKGSGTFLIDHPLDPANRDLAHGFVEAPRYDLIYRGTVALVNGRATVDIDAASNMSPGTFAALTTNAVVASLQNQSGFAAVRPEPVAGGSFDIVSVDPTCSDTVAWVVIAERNDAFVKHMDDNCDAEGRFIPEREKPE